MLKILIALFLLLGICLALYWLVVTPKASKPQAPLEARTNFDYQTSLRIQKDLSFPKALYLRRVRDSVWQTSGEHTDYTVKEYQEASMTVTTIKPDAYLKDSTNSPRIIIGRLTDQGSGMHGWHVTMIRQGQHDIHFDRHQRYKVWIEKDFPSGFNDKGEPTSNNLKRWYFTGLADIIAEEHYQGYVEPQEGDK